MNNHVTIKAIDLAKSPIAVSSEEADLIFEKARSLVEKGTPVTICFAGIKVIIPAMLHIAIGPLYDIFPEDVIESLVKVEGLSEIDMKILKHVAESTKRYNANPEAYDAAWLEEVGDYD